MSTYRKHDPRMPCHPHHSDSKGKAIWSRESTQTEWHVEWDDRNLSPGLAVCSLCDLKEVSSINIYCLGLAPSTDSGAEEVRIARIDHVLTWGRGLIGLGKWWTASHLLLTKTGKTDSNFCWEHHTRPWKTLIGYIVHHAELKVITSAKNELSK